MQDALSLDLTPEEMEYVFRFDKQADKFNKHGNVSGADPRYDYGGTGELDSDHDKAMYLSIGRKLLQQAHDRQGGDAEKAARDWHFGEDGAKDSSNQDERYMLAVMDEGLDVGQTVADAVHDKEFQESMPKRVYETLVSEAKRVFGTKEDDPDAGFGRRIQEQGTGMMVESAIAGGLDMAVRSEELLAEKAAKSGVTPAMQHVMDRLIPGPEAIMRTGGVILDNILGKDTQASMEDVRDDLRLSAAHRAETYPAKSTFEQGFHSAAPTLSALGVSLATRNVKLGLSTMTPLMGVFWEEGEKMGLSYEENLERTTVNFATEVVGESMPLNIAAKTVKTLTQAFVKLGAVMSTEIAEEQFVMVANKTYDAIEGHDTLWGSFDEFWDDVVTTTIATLGMAGTMGGGAFIADAGTINEARKEEKALEELEASLTPVDNVVVPDTGTVDGAARPVVSPRPASDSPTVVDDYGDVVSTQEDLDLDLVEEAPAIEVEELTEDDLTPEEQAVLDQTTTTRKVGDHTLRQVDYEGTDNRSIVIEDAEGVSSGTVDATVAEDGTTIITKSLVHEDSRGTGGAAYRMLMENAVEQGADFSSDSSVSLDAAKIYGVGKADADGNPTMLGPRLGGKATVLQDMEGAGYELQVNPTATWNEAKKQYETTDGKPAFTFTKKGVMTEAQLNEAADVQPEAEVAPTEVKPVTAKRGENFATDGEYVVEMPDGVERRIARDPETGFWYDTEADSLHGGDFLGLNKKEALTALEDQMFEGQEDIDPGVAAAEEAARQDASITEEGSLLNAMEESLSDPDLSETDIDDAAHELLEQMDEQEALARGEHGDVRLLDEAGEPADFVDMEDIPVEVIERAMQIKEEQAAAEAAAQPSQEEVDAQALADEIDLITEGIEAETARLELQERAEANVEETRISDEEIALEDEWITREALAQGAKGQARVGARKRADKAKAALDLFREEGPKAGRMARAAMDKLTKRQDTEEARAKKKAQKETDKAQRAEERANQKRDRAARNAAKRNDTAKRSKPNFFQRWFTRSIGKNAMISRKGKTTLRESEPLESAVREQENTKAALHTDELIVRDQINELIEENGDSEADANAYFRGDELAGANLSPDVRQAIAVYRNKRNGGENELILTGELGVFSGSTAKGKAGPRVSMQELKGIFMKWKGDERIDSFKQHLVDLGYTVNGVTDNMDEGRQAEYSRRSFALFRNGMSGARWAKMMKANHPEVYQALADWLQTPEGQKYSKIEGQDPDSAIRMITERALKGGSIFSGENIIKSDRAVLKKRKDVPDVLRAWYGEVTNTGQVISSTLKGQRRIIEQRNFLESILPMLLESNQANVGDTLGDIDVALDAQNVNTEGHVLEGVYVTAEVYRSLKDPQGSIQSLRVESDDPLLQNPLLGDSTPRTLRALVQAFRYYAKVGAPFKAALIMANPGSYFKNYVSAPIIAWSSGAQVNDVAGGMSDGILMLKWGFHTHGVHLPLTSQDFSVAEKTRIMELEAAGVVDESVLAEAVFAPLAESLEKEMLGGASFEDAYRKVTSGAKLTAEIAKAVFSMADTAGRAAVYRSELRMLEQESAAGHDVNTPEGLKAEAGKRARRLYPTYSELPAWAKLSAVMPMSAFVAFNVAMGQVMYNSVKMSLEDMGTGGSARRMKGTRRLATLSSTLYASSEIIPLMIQTMFDDWGDDDEEYVPTPDSARARWDQGDMMAGVVLDGVTHEFNLSSYNPFDIVANATHGMIRTAREEGGFQEYGEAAVDGILNYTEPVIGTTSPGTNIVSGVGKMAEALSMAHQGDDVGMEKALDEAEKRFTNVLPGAVKIPKRALTGKDTSIQTLTALVGMKARVRDPDKMGFFAVQEPLVVLSGMRREMNRVLYDELASEDMKQDAMVEYARRAQEYQQDKLLPLIDDFRAMGMDEKQINTALRSQPLAANRELARNGMSKTLAISLQRGRPFVGPPNYRNMKSNFGERYARRMERLWMRAQREARNNG